MVREIIHVQVGQCGNQVGTAFLHSVCKEHFLELDQTKDTYATWHNENFADEDGDGIADELEQIDVLFRPNQNDNKAGARWTPRAVCVDLEPGTLDVIKQHEIGGLLDHTNMKFGCNGAGNNWAKGHYTEGAEIVEDVTDIVRREMEKADCPQGFQLFHSLGGGTGSGMGTLLLLKIRDQYPDKITTTYSVFPSPKVSDTVVEPYNAVLSSHQLLENSDETFIVDNEALYNIMHNVLKRKTVEYKVLNELIARVTCGITSSLRFPGMLNGDLRKLGVNLVPFPRLHFFLAAFAPLAAEDASANNNVSEKSLAKEASSARNFYCNVKPEDGKFLAVSYTFRGPKVTSERVDAAMKEIQTKDNNCNFVDWIPNNIKSSVVKTAAIENEMSATVIGNSTALKGIFQRLATQFGSMYRRKAFLHWYKGEGMDEMEFQEADKNVRDLITEYQDKEDAVYEEEDDTGAEESDAS